MTAQHFANIIWASVKLADSGDESLLALLPTLEVRAKGVRAQMKPQEIRLIRQAAKQLLISLTDTDISEVCLRLSKI